jgi:hypothetical protein
LSVFLCVFRAPLHLLLKKSGVFVKYFLTTMFRKLTILQLHLLIATTYAFHGVFRIGHDESHEANC